MIACVCVGVCVCVFSSLASLASASAIVLSGGAVAPETMVHSWSVRLIEGKNYLGCEILSDGTVIKRSSACCSTDALFLQPATCRGT